MMVVRNERTSYPSSTTSTTMVAELIICVSEFWQHCFEQTEVSGGFLGVVDEVIASVKEPRTVPPAS